MSEPEEKPSTEGRLLTKTVSKEGCNAMIELLQSTIKAVEEGLIVSLEIIVTDIDGDPISAHCSMVGVPTCLIVGAYETGKFNYQHRHEKLLQEQAQEVGRALFEAQFLKPENIQ